MKSLLIGVAVGVLVLTPMLLMLGVISIAKWRDKRRKRRSPLTSELVRPPAYSLSERIEDLRWDLATDIFLVTLLPVAMVVALYVEVILGANEAKLPLPGGPVLVISVAVAVIVFAVRIFRRYGVMRAYRDGRDGEWATAQLLEPIIAGGGRVLHDIQATGFNIDHVVIAPGGVFAIETKHRLKPTTGRPLDNAKVGFDGKALRFPDWTDTTTAEQAAAQARWLSERLSRSTGQAVRVKPVIALPGWYVEVTSRSEVWAMNPKSCKYMLKAPRGEAPLCQETIQRIAFQVEQLCRLPAPGAAHATNKSSTA